jgi:hypothetical protein
MTISADTIQLIAVLGTGVALFVYAFKEAFFGLPYVKESDQLKLRRSETNPMEVKLDPPSVKFVVTDELLAALSTLSERLGGPDKTQDTVTSMPAANKVTRITKPKSRKLAGAS